MERGRGGGEEECAAPGWPDTIVPAPLLAMSHPSDTLCINYSVDVRTETDRTHSYLYLLQCRMLHVCLYSDHLAL